MIVLISHALKCSAVDATYAAATGAPRASEQRAGSRCLQSCELGILGKYSANKFAGSRLVL